MRMAASTSRRIPAAKPPLAPCSVKSCRTVFKSSGSVRWVVMDLLWMCLETPQQETIMARPRPVYDGGSPPSGAAAAPLASPPPPPPPPEGGLGGVKKSNLQNHVYTGFTSAQDGYPWSCPPFCQPTR